jgi:hypothetical protein
MEPVFFVMAILGCGDAGGGCTEARIEPARYATAAQCRADQVNALSRNTDLSFPSIAAACRASGPLVAAKGKPASKS